MNLFTNWGGNQRVAPGLMLHPGIFKSYVEKRATALGRRSGNDSCICKRPAIK